MTCEKITYYIEKGYLSQLNLTEKMQVNLHSLYCKSCKKYPKDSLAINRMLAKLEKTEENLKFSDNEKLELRQLLENFSSAD